ncbi:MAG TPA: hypothetical protein VM425_07175 [Myxococcota bacterium]|nr:hypothetical protein [Myxococcota bacterium]
MQKIILCMGFFLLTNAASACADYAQIDNQEHYDGIRGRLWINPNPIRYPALLSGDDAAMAYVGLYNIGSEDVTIDAIHLDGDPDFYFLKEDFLNYVFPSAFHGSIECGQYHGMYGPFFYEPKSKGNVSATLVIETSDPTSPTMRVPLTIGEDPDYPNNIHDSAVGTLPIIKPNPIRFDTTNIHEKQDIEVCIYLFCNRSPSRLTKLAAPGKSFSIQGLSDQQGNSVSLPVEYNTNSSVVYKTTVSYTPHSSNEDGELVVQFEDDLGDERTLLVPILFR